MAFFRKNEFIVHQCSMRSARYMSLAITGFGDWEMVLRYSSTLYIKVFEDLLVIPSHHLAGNQI